MRTLLSFLVGGILLVGVASCDNATRTSAEAPGSTNETAAAPDTQTAQQNQGDATSETRKRQLESDIRAREDRNNATGGDADRDDDDLESEVRSKLEANLPASQLTIEAEDGVVTVTGIVPTQAQLDRIPTLAQEIKGVTNVVSQATVAPAQSRDTN
jgi:hyperosmotically inducible periplasmic protein